MNNIIALLIVGFAAGLFSGFLGIGGGIIIVPSLVYFLSMTQHQAQGTSLFMFLLPIGVLGVYNYYKGGNVDFKAAAIMAATFVGGSYIGSRISLTIDEVTLKKAFGLLMLFMSIRLIFFK